MNEYWKRKIIYIKELEEEIEVLSQKIPDAIFEGTNQDLISLLFKLDSLRSRLTFEQSHLISLLTSQLKIESYHLDRMLGVKK